MRLNKIILLLGLVLTVSCIDRFIPDTTGYDEVLFIECLLSDDTTAQSSVKVSVSAPVSSETGDRIIYQPMGVSGARISVLTSDGRSYSCIDNLGGSYSIPWDLRIETGTSYKLVVSYSGNQFESDWQEVRPSPPVDSISFKHELQKLSEDGSATDGYRFYVSTHETGESPAFYRWIVDATFEYTVPYTATHIWDGRKTVTASNKLLRTCWKSKSIPGNYLGKTTGLSDNRIIEVPLNFESCNGDELSIRYCLNVKQYRTSESAMVFWENIDKLLNQTGSLYETQPFRIEGNIHCISDSSVYVAGIFEVAGFSTIRKFVDKPVEFQVIPISCLLMTVGTDIPWWRLPAGSWVTESNPGFFQTATPSCYDCRLREGTLEKPPFWLDH